MFLILAIIVGFNQTTLFVNETTKNLNVLIVRSGDLSKPFSLICYTRQQTAIENKDYVGRESFEQSRIYFEAGERVSELDSFLLLLILLNQIKIYYKGKKLYGGNNKRFDIRSGRNVSDKVK